MAAEIELKPCPFPACGSSNVYIGYNDQDYVADQVVICHDCGAQGPIAAQDHQPNCKLLCNCQCKADVETLKREAAERWNSGR